MISFRDQFSPFPCFVAYVVSFVCQLLLFFFLFLLCIQVGKRDSDDDGEEMTPECIDTYIIA